LKDKKERDFFLHETNLKGVTTRPIWTLMNKLNMFQGSQCGELSNAEWFEERVANIPSTMLIT
jgi:perosamine synthetase